jgi:hypothetical protein
MTSVKLKYLESTLRKRFDYNPEAAAAAEKQQAADVGLYKKSIASNMVAQAQQTAVAAWKAAATAEDCLADPVSKYSPIGKLASAIERGKWLGEKAAVEGKLVLVAFWSSRFRALRSFVLVRFVDTGGGAT